MIKKAAAVTLSAVMALAPVSTVFAGPDDVIDTTRKGSITIHKYDMTAAAKKGVLNSDTNPTTYVSDGKQNTKAEADLANYAIQGVEFTYMKVSDIQTVSEGGKISIMYHFPDELQTILGLTDSRGDDLFTSDQINDALKHLLEPGVNTEGKNKLEDYIKTGQGHHAMQLTDADGVSKLDNVELGLYFFVETKVPANVHTTTDPFFVTVPMTDLEGESWFYDVHLYPKNQVNIPDLDKQVRQHDDAALYNKKEYHDTATASEGDVIDYIIVSHLPKITSKATYLTTYTFTDIIDKGIVYNKDQQIYIFNSKDDAFECDPGKAAYTFASNEYNYNYSTEGAADKGMEGPSMYSYGGFETPYAEDPGRSRASGDPGVSGSRKNRSKAVFSFTSSGLDKINFNPGFSEKWIVISYSATMHSDDTPILGDTGNTNDVNLTWKRTNENNYDQLNARCRVYTFSLNVKKEFKKDEEHQNVDPAKVKFVLQNKTDGKYIKASQPVPGSGNYYVIDDDSVTDEAGATVFSPESATGKLVINGLEADTYILTEIETEDGFSLLKDPITIIINCTVDEFKPSETTLYDKEDAAANKAEFGEDRHVIETNGDRASATVDGSSTNMSDQPLDTQQSTHAYVDMTITNTPGFKLPATGGIGTILFTVAGCSVAFFGIALLTRKNKKERD